jgi:hypothetical protein
MRENYERLAWTILLISFFVFCLTAISIPLGIRQLIVTAAIKYPARLTPHDGAVSIRRIKQDTWTAIREQDQEIPELQEGTALRTEPSSTAVVWLFDGSNLQVSNNSQAAILKARSPRFDSSPQPDSIVVEVLGGKVIVAVAPASQERSRQFEIRTPHGLILLEEGTYSITVTETETEISVKTVKAVGHAKVEAAGQSIDLKVGQRGRIEANHPPDGPLPGARNLLVNGDFQQPLSVGWTLLERHERKEEQAGSVTIETLDEGGRVAHFVRQGNNQYHGENVIVQEELNRDVREATSVEVRLNIRLIYQSLSGGGSLSYEFPLMVRLLYRDAHGREHDWVRGFYYDNWDNLIIHDYESYRGILIPRNLWHPFESDNLMLSLGDEKPAHLISLEVMAQGHDYESMASDIGLFVTE